MKKYLVVASYKCFINGVQTNTIDTRVICKQAKSIDAAKLEVIKLPIHEYDNIDNNKVEWKFKDILSVEEFIKFEDGKELIGFIYDLQEN